jgi:nucleoid-associated protein YgaU
MPEEALMTVATEFAPSVSIPARTRVLARVEPLSPAAPVEVPPRLASVTVLRPPARPEAPGVRLTPRGVVVLTLAVLLVGLAVVWVARLSAPAATGPAPVAPQVVTVQAGDTLWTIAEQVAPNRDPRDEVGRLQRHNHLAGVDLVPGQQLRVP